MPERSIRTSFRARQVAAALRRHREAAGLSTGQAGAAISVSQSKISRIETGASTLQETDLAVLLGLYRVSTDVRDELIEMYRRAAEPGWWSSQPGLPRIWRGVMDVEDQATRISNFETSLVPGLLQTADYARALLDGMTPATTPGETDALVAARLGRQALLARRDAPHLLAVIDEAALRRPIGAPGVMRRQVLHLATVAGQPNVLLRVLPLAAGAHDGLRGAFSLYEFADDSALVFVENQSTGLFLEETGDVNSYRAAFTSILGTALAPGASTALLGQIADDLPDAPAAPDEQATPPEGAP